MNREEKRDATVVWRTPFLILAVTSIYCKPSFPYRFAKISFGRFWSPYALLLEINQPGDEQASLVYSVEIDNSLPRSFQLLDLRGFPKREEDGEDGKETWGLYYVDESFTSALELIDSALLTIDRDE